MEEQKGFFPTWLIKFRSIVGSIKTGEQKNFLFLKVFGGGPS